MTKIMLVEDDNNLREIYEARLKAEGFEIVAAADGEAALALAANEHPDLVITDVMMPKISGFEMLDILRNTEGLRNVKVIMLTALGQAEDNARAGALGADRYLVKSQVTLEDIIKAAHDVLNGEAAASSQAVAAATGTVPTSEPAAAPAAPAPPVVDMPVASPEPVTVDMPVAAAPGDPAPTPEPAPEPAPQPAAEPAPEPTVTQEPVPVAEPPAPELTLPPVEDAPPEAPAETPAAPEMETPSTDSQAVPPPVADEAPTAAAEENTMRSQIDQFLHGTEQTGEPAAAPAQPPADDSQANPDGDAPADDTQQTDDAQVVDATAPPTGEENPAEIAQDDAAPDLGQFAVHPEDQPASDTPEVQGGPQLSPDQAQDDKVVSSAINDMLATTGTGEVSTPDGQPADDGGSPGIKKTSSSLQTGSTEYSDGLPSEDKPAGGAPVANDPVSPSFSSVHGGTSSMKSRVVQPIDEPKPDINQLLNVEDAKYGAQSAANAPQAPTGPVVSSDNPDEYQPPNQKPANPQTPPPAGPPGHDGVDPNSIAL